ncbi:MAG: TIGR00282 family metallophosphoesterase [bacterium]|nr:TIGR00282 family metallophosphoesterase [bacterium]MDT8396734.1 TIGR00282 family metallophosphoesterase [bacterium]
MSKETNTIRVLFIGDVVGKPGRVAVRELIDSLVDHHHIDLVAANAENAAGGFGITSETAGDLFSAGVHLLTTGNHVWDKKEALDLLANEERIVRPANYPPGAPGLGLVTVKTPGGVPVTVVNISGRVFMDNVDCPFRTMDRILEDLAGAGGKCVVVDFHAEATSEKRAMALYLDGRVSALLGTHTHIQTADERIMPGGTAYLTDLGMTGNGDGSVIGIDFKAARYRFLTQMPARFDLAKGVPVLNGAFVEMDTATGKALSIQRVTKSLDRSVSP